MVGVSTKLYFLFYKITITNKEKNIDISLMLLKIILNIRYLHIHEYLLKSSMIFNHLLVSLFISIVILFASCNSGGRGGNSGNAELKEIGLFTVIVRKKGSISKSQINTSFFQKTKIPVKVIRSTIFSGEPSWSPENPSLDEAYGRSLEKIFNEKGKDARFVSLSAIGLFASGKSPLGEDNLDWLFRSGIDTVVEIEQKELTLDYPTRVPDLGPANILFALLFLDMWWVDLAGRWKLENNFSFHIFNLKTRSVIASGIPEKSSVSTKKHLLSSVTPEILAAGVAATSDKSLRKYFR